MVLVPHHLAGKPCKLCTFTARRHLGCLPPSGSSVAGLNSRRSPLFYWAAKWSLRSVPRQESLPQILASIWALQLAWDCGNVDASCMTLRLTLTCLLILGWRLCTSLGFSGFGLGLVSFSSPAKWTHTHTQHGKPQTLGRKDMITARYFNLSTIVCSLVWATLAAWVVDCVLLTRLTKRIFAHLCGIAFNIFQLRPALSSKASTPSRKLVHSSKWIEVRNCLALMQTTSSCPSPMSYRVYHNGTWLQGGEWKLMIEGKRCSLFICAGGRAMLSSFPSPSSAAAESSP